MIEDVSCLFHFDEKRRFAAAKPIARPNAGENTVHQPDTCPFGRYKTTHLSHDDDECDLPEESALTRHVGPGNQRKLLALAVEQQIIRHKRFIPQAFQNRMAARPKFKYSRIVDDGLSGSDAAARRRRVTAGRRYVPPPVPSLAMREALQRCNHTACRTVAALPGPVSLPFRV